MLRIGLLGCGRIGQVHAMSILRVPTAQLVAVADAFPASAQALAEKSGAQVRSVDAIMASDDIDAVIICTPTDTHYDLIHAAAKAGKAIFCEKPVDMSADRIRECINVVQANNVPFLTAFNRPVPVTTVRRWPHCSRSHVPLRRAPPIATRSCSPSPMPRKRDYSAPRHSSPNTRWPSASRR